MDEEIVKIKTVVVEARIRDLDSFDILRSWESKKTGNIIYLHGLGLSNREELNNVWKDFHKAERFNQTVDIKEKTKGEIINWLMNKYDHNTEYIENGKRQRYAESCNRNILNLVKKVEEL